MAITFPFTKGKELIFSKLQVRKESSMEAYFLNKLYKYVCFWFLKIMYGIGQLQQKKGGSINMVISVCCSRKWGKY